MKSEVFFGRSRVGGLRFFFLSVALSLPSAFAQTQPAKRCDLVVNTTPGLGADTACLDLLALTSGGTPIQTGNNVTRISATGLKLCKDAFTVTSGGAADVVFIVDNSGSMWSRYGYVNGTDTSFYDEETPGGCTFSPSGNLTYNVLDDNWRRVPLVLTRTITNVSAAPSNSCIYAGDPYNSRAVVVKSAIDYMATNSPLSTAGVMGFASDTMNAQPPLLLNVPANVTQVKNMMRLDSVGATYYDVPLAVAKAWLNNPQYTHNSKHAIVFISDGAPQSGHNGQNLVDATMPPIYSIFLGRITTPDTANLKALSDASGGQFFHVDPTKNGGIQTVMDTIIQKITATTLPKTVQITNSTVGQTSVATNTSLDSNGNLNLSLDSILALTQGLNNITVNVTGGDGTQSTYNFTIQADGPTVGQSTSDLECFDAPTLVMLNAQGQQDSLYSLTATSYNIKLTRTPTDVGPVVVTAISKDSTKPVGWGDSEFVSLPVGTPAGGDAVYQGPYPFNGLSNAPTQKNGTLESDPGGELVLTWVYPRDPRENATYTLFGSKMIVTLPPTATPPSKNFTTLDSAFSVTLLAGETGAVIHYTLNGSVPDSNSPVYTGPIPITATTTIQAIDTKTNQVQSQVVTFVYNESVAPKVSTPVATPPGSRDTSYIFTTTPLAVVLSDTTPGATIFYSFDSAASAAGANLFVQNSGVLKVYATKPGMYPSDTITIHYNFNAPTQVTVLFPNDSTTPPTHGIIIPEPTSPPNIAFIPIDQQGVPLAGTADGKCGTCFVGGDATVSTPFVGPVINLEIPGPAEYDFQIFSKYGDFMVSGSGKIDASDIPLLSQDPADHTKFQARIIWTGRCANGTRAGTGVYILRSTVRTLGIDSSTPLSSQSTLVLFGLLRQGKT